MCRRVRAISAVVVFKTKTEICEVKSNGKGLLVGRRSEYYLGCLFSLCSVSCFLSRSARTRSGGPAEMLPTMA